MYAVPTSAPAHLSQNQQAYGTNNAPPYPGYTDQQGQPYPQPYPQPGYAPQAGAGAPPPSNMTDAQRQEWEAEQYAK